MLFSILSVQIPVVLEKMIEQVVLFPEIGRVKIFSSLTRLHSRKYQNIYFLLQKKKKKKKKAHTHKRKSKETKEGSWL